MISDYRQLMAKTDRTDMDLYLPLWMHLKDTAGVMRHLIHRWVPQSVICASGLDFSDFEKTAVFSAAVHDIGKATSYFQSIIASESPRRDTIEGAGFMLRSGAASFAAKGKTPHSYAGQWILQSDETGIGVSSSLADVVGAHHGVPLSVTFSPEPDLIKVYGANFFGEEGNTKAKRIWEESWHRIVTEALKEAGAMHVDELPNLTSQAQTLLAGLLITADWLASNTAYFPLLSVDDDGSTVDYPDRIRRGCEMMAFPEGWRPGTLYMDDVLFAQRFGFYPNAVQREMIQTAAACREPGIFILEAQMGVGKTEAALAAAELLSSEKEAGGVFFGLPTQATSNGMFRRLYEWAQNVSEDTAAAIRLAHGAAQLNEDYEKLLEHGRALVDDVPDTDETSRYDNEENIRVHSWFQGNKKALLADFVIGTVDQFLMASLKHRYYMLRHLGLAGKVVIIDECHAYDAYMNQYLDRTLEWMAAYGVPVILLSATLPAQRRTQLVRKYVRAYSHYYLGKKKPVILPPGSGWERAEGYPLLTWSDGEQILQEEISQETDRKTVCLERADSMDEVLDELRMSLQDGGCACVIMNTVRGAQEIFKILSEGMPDARVELYHARFTTPDRADKEASLLRHIGRDSAQEDRCRYILVGTQVLEQSLDYDADLMVTQLCPMDLLLQRMGRLHRHDRRRPQRLQRARCILLQDTEASMIQDGDMVLAQDTGPLCDAGTRAVYGDYLLLRTWQFLPDVITLPDDIPGLVQAVYRENDDGSPQGDTEKREITPEQMEKARSVFADRRRGMQERAKGYLLKTLPKNIEGILDNADETAECAAEKKVRDGVSAISVLLMQEDENGFLHRAGSDGHDRSYDPHTVPDAGEGRQIARQKLSLPGIFSQVWMADRVIRELEDINRRKVSAWQMSPWIKGELVLILDQQGRAELCGYQLSYSIRSGLMCEKSEDENS